MKYIVVLFFLTSPALGQSIKLLSGSVARLRGEKSYDIMFTYDNMLIGNGTTEKEYLKEKRKQWELKEEGYGDEFVKRWFIARKDQYEPVFIASFKKYAKFTIPNPKASYTLIVKTQRTEGGWDGGVIGHPGMIDGEVWIVESANKDNVIARIAFVEIPGNNSNGGDFEMITRIQNAYKIAGKGLGDFLRRKTK